MDRSDAIKLENQLCFPLYAASREVIKLYRPFLDELGLTYTQYIAMLVLWEEKKISVKQMGKRLYLDSGTLTPVLKSLEAKGLVKRYRFARDERVLIVECTAEGEALQENALNVPEQIAGCIRLKKEESDALYSLLCKLLEATAE